MAWDTSAGFLWSGVGILGGFWTLKACHFEKQDIALGLKGKAKTRPDILRAVLGHWSLKFFKKWNFTEWVLFKRVYLLQVIYAW